MLLLWSLLVILGATYQFPWPLTVFRQIPLVLAIVLLLTGFGKRILQGGMQNPSDPINRRNRLILLSTGAFVFGFYLFVNGLFEVLMLGRGVVDYGWSAGDVGAYFIIVFGLTFGSMLLIAGVVAFKRFIDLSGYF